MVPKKMQFKIDNNAHAKAIQHALFELGYAWEYSGTQVKDLRSTYLRTGFWGNNYMTDGDNYREEHVDYELVNGEIRMVGAKPEFKEMQFKVHDQTHAEAIQKALFEAGYEWYTGGQKLKWYGQSYMFTGYDIPGKITHGAKDSKYIGKDYVLVDGVIYKDGEQPPAEAVKAPLVVAFKSRRDAAKERIVEVLKAMLAHAEAEIAVPEDLNNEYRDLCQYLA